MYTPDTDTRTGLIPEWLRLRAMTAHLAHNHNMSDAEAHALATEMLKLATITYEEN